MLQSGFFDVENRYRKLNERDPLTRLNELIDGENCRDTLNKIRMMRNRRNKVSNDEKTIK